LIDSTMRIVEFARSARLPHTWQDAVPPGSGALPLVRLPGGAELRGPSTGQVSRALGIGRELAPREEVDLVVVGGGPAGLGAAVYGESSTWKIALKAALASRYSFVGSIIIASGDEPSSKDPSPGLTITL